MPSQGIVPVLPAPRSETYLLLLPLIQPTDLFVTYHNRCALSAAQGWCAMLVFRCQQSVNTLFDVVSGGCGGLRQLILYFGHVQGRVMVRGDISWTIFVVVVPV